MRLVVFIDESGLPVHCNFFSYGAIAKIVPKNISYYSIGAKELQAIKKQADLAGEVKFRKLIYKIGLSEVSSIISLLRKQKYYLFFKRVHVKNPTRVRLECIAKLLEEISNQISCSNIVMIIDECPLRLTDVKHIARQFLKPKNIHVCFKDSKKVAGLQLADIVVGYFSKIYSTLNE